MPPTNLAAWLDSPNTPLQIREAPLPVPGPDEILVQNAAVAFNGVDNWMMEAGVFVKNWPAVLGSDVAGTVYAVGSEVKRFQVGDRVVGHGLTLITNRPSDGAFALYTLVPTSRASILPASISFTQGVALPLAIGAASCALFLQKPGEVMPGVPLSLLGLPYPSLEKDVKPLRKVLVIYGGSSVVGSVATQLATASGVEVIAVTGAANFELSRKGGAVDVFDHKDAEVVKLVIAAVRKSGSEFIGVFDAIATPETYPIGLAILEGLGGGHLACSHPPPKDVPANVKASMIFSVNEVAIPVFEDYVAPALESGKLQVLTTPIVVGKGLEYIQAGLTRLQEGVSGSKVVVEL